MIHAILFFNEERQVRLTKFYSLLDDEKKKEYLHDVISLLSKRKILSSFIDGELTKWGKGTKLIYKKYARLFIVFVVDDSEPELGILEIIDTLMQCLDKQFKDVCELDIELNVEKVHFVIDEMIQGGLLFESNVDVVIRNLEAQKKVDQTENPLRYKLRRVKESKVKMFG
mmetsp:Transcript_5167/g.5624  ORF Transcript_5167/g.5624 Transcript_5167/m.5624 type:complete len:170 (-) Transcript_5167:198-707(-)